MLVLIALLLALIPAVAILYPFLRKADPWPLLEDEGSKSSELSRRWEAAVAGLKNTELEWAIGNLTDDDYRQLRDEYMTDAAMAMKAMDLVEERERELFSAIDDDVRGVRERALGGDSKGQAPGD